MRRLCRCTTTVQGVSLVARPVGGRIGAIGKDCGAGIGGDQECCRADSGDERRGAFLVDWSSQQFLVTASAVYDAVEPIIVWRAFYTALENKDEALLRWTLYNLPQKDEEVTDVHIPIVLDHILAKLQVCRRLALADLQNGQSSNIDLASALLAHIRSSMFTRQSLDHEEGTELLVAIYTAPNSSLELVEPQVLAQAIPRIVRTIFDLSAEPKTNTDSLIALDMALRLIDIEAVPIGHLKGSEWLDKLVTRLHKASRRLILTNGRRASFPLSMLSYLQH